MSDVSAVAVGHDGSVAHVMATPGVALTEVDRRSQTVMLRMAPQLPNIIDREAGHGGI